MLNKHNVEAYNYHQLIELKNGLEKNNRPIEERDMVDKYIIDFMTFKEKYGESVLEHSYDHAKKFYDMKYDEVPSLIRGIKDVSRMTLSNTIPLESLLANCIMKLREKIPMYYDMLRTGSIVDELCAMLDLIDQEEADQLYDSIIDFFKSHIDDTVDYEENFCLLLTKETVVSLARSIKALVATMNAYTNYESIKSDRFIFNEIIAKDYNLIGEDKSYVQQMNLAGFIDGLYRNPKTKNKLDKISILVNHGDHNHIEEIPVYKKTSEEVENNEG